MLNKVFSAVMFVITHDSAYPITPPALCFDPLPVHETRLDTLLELVVILNVGYC